MQFLSEPYDGAVLAKAQDFLAGLPDVEAGLIARISLHWAAMKYGWAVDLAAKGDVIPYNVVADIDANGSFLLVQGMNPGLNARQIGADGETMDVTYCGSCWHRNSHAVAASISALANGSAADFGPYPLTEHLVDAMCAGAAALCTKYRIDASDPKTCYTHAEAAILDGYFWGDPTPDGDTRGDLCVLEAHPEMSTDQLKANAPLAGAMLRRRIHAYKVALLA